MVSGGLEPGDEFRWQLLFCCAVERLEKTLALRRLGLGFLRGERLDFGRANGQFDQFDLGLKRLRLFADVTDAMSGQALPALKQGSQLKEFSCRLKMLVLERFGRLGKVSRTVDVQLPSFP